VRVRHQLIDDFLRDLADRVPAPGGGAVAALQLAQAAALLGMVTRFSDGPGYADHADVIERVRTESDAVREEALQTAEDDVAAYTAVGEAYRMPGGAGEQDATRSAAIAEALAGAVEPPVAVIAAAARLVVLAEQLLPVGNPQVVADLAAAVEAVRAAAAISRVNIEANLRGVADADERVRLTAVAAGAGTIADRAGAVTATVRDTLTP
jgi:formiminotetrahydrofolate cyclodeaminase